MNRAPWCTPLALDVGATARVRIGPLELLLERRANEWRVLPQSSVDDPLHDEIVVKCPDPDVVIDDDQDPATVFRYVFTDVPGTFELHPRLADRAVIIRPVAPFRIAAGASVDVFVSTPVWVQMVLQPGGLALFDVPTVRPSDTWFGPNTREGELCYISRTLARLELAQLTRPVARALSCVRLVNNAADLVTLERVHLPAPHLALYQDAAGTLWTQPLEITLGDGGTAIATPVDGPPAHAVQPTPIAAARRAPERGLILRALGALWR